MTLLAEADLVGALVRVPGWRHEGAAIQREFRFRDFAETMKFVNRVASLAEEANHHPDISIRYNRALLELSTHDEGGLTERDFALAEQIDGIA